MAGYFLMICTSRGDMTIPICEVPGCCAPAQFTQKNKAGERRYRKSSWVRRDYDAPNGWCCATHHMNHLAKQNSFASTTQWKNSKHPYRKYRKDYCENIDGRLGFKCTYTPPPQELIEKVIESGFYSGIEVDHIDGDPSNNDPENLQSLCGCCHHFKGLAYKDYLSPGRKELGLNSNGTFSMVKTA